MKELQLGEVLITNFPVFQEDGITPYTGLINSDFDIIIINGDSASSVDSNVIEIGSTGIYSFSFTPDNIGYWYILISFSNENWSDELFVFYVLNRDVSEAQLNISYNNALDIIYFDAWLERGGRLISDGLVSCLINVYDNEGVLLFSIDSSSALDNGHFDLSYSIANFDNIPHSIVISITDNIGVVTTSHSFTVI